MATLNTSNDKSPNRDIIAVQKRRAYFTVLKPEKCSFRWTIEGFSRTTAAVSTALFPSEKDEEKCKWILTFHPSGEYANNERYVCINLTMIKGPAKDVMADFGLRLRDSNEREICYRQDDHKFSVNGSYTWEQLPKREHLKKVLQDDVLIIDLNIVASVDEVNMYQDPESPLPFLRMVDNYAELRRSGKLCDATIFVGATKFPVHSVVLAARSQVFMAMFEHSTKEKQSSVVQIEDIDCRTMEHLLDFIYSCELPECDVPLAISLFGAADKYDFLDLKEHCANHLATSLNSSNVVEILYFADRYSACRLKEEAIEFIRLNKTRLSEIKNFNTILEDDVHMLGVITQNMAASP